MEQQDPLTTPHPLLVGYRSDSRLALSARYRLAATAAVSYTRNVYRATPTGLANRLTQLRPDRSGRSTVRTTSSSSTAHQLPHRYDRAKGATHTCARPRTRVRFRSAAPLPSSSPPICHISATLGRRRRRRRSSDTFSPASPLPAELCR